MKKFFVISFLVLVFFFVTSCSPEVSVKTYTISFNANGADSGTAPNNILVSSGEKYIIPSCGTLSKNGYIFSHWNTISDGSGSSYTKSSVCKAEEDLTLYAQWKVISYTIEYDLDGGTLPEGKNNPNTYTIETETFTLNNPEREGYEFVGWRLNNGESNKNVSILKGSSENKIFTAVWRDVNSFSISYDSNGGEGKVDTTYKYEGQTVKIASDISLVRSGYTFSHWNTKPDGTGKDYNVEDLYSDNNDLSLYAQWKVISYTIEYDLDGGTFPEGKNNPNTYTIETETFTLNNPKREGYKFVGWRLNNGEPNKNVSILKGSSENKIFTAVWVKTLSFTYIPSTDSYAFSCKNNEVVSLTIPKTYNNKPVTVISDYAFCNFDSLTNVTIPDSVTSIGEQAFWDCDSLTSITIPDSVTSIGDSAFRKCGSLTSITIPGSVTSIGDSAFEGCKSLHEVYILGETSFGYNTFGSCYNVTKFYFGSLKGISGLISENSIRSVVLLDSVTSIGDSAFRYCTSLTNVTIPDSVTSIGDSAFYSCTSLTSVTIPNSVTSIGEQAFWYCTSLTSVTIPNSVESIGEQAFWNCDSLTSITIPGSVTSIGEQAFWDCDSLTSVTIQEGVESIGNKAFSSCNSLTSITIPNSVESVGRYAFYNCGSLKEIHYCGPLKSFLNIKNIENAQIPSAVMIYCTDAAYSGSEFYAFFRQ